MFHHADDELFVRPAELADLSALLSLEQACFDSDRLSRRSFRHFILDQRSDIQLLVKQRTIAGYFLVLYRRGTSLARLYSLAVLPSERKQGYAQKLLNAAEAVARQRRCVFLRLEVRFDNRAAIQLYRTQGYQDFDVKHDFYEDHSDALCMQKRVYFFDASAARPLVGYIQQSTSFTCGPASLLMAMNYFEPNQHHPYLEELEIWREATTIFMTSGHGGCGPRGLALAAYKRGFAVQVLLNQDGPLFVDSVRTQEKKSILEWVYQVELQKVEQAGISVQIQDFSLTELLRWLNDGYLVLILISTWQFDRSKAPHWVLLCDADDHFVYLNDPDVDTEQGRTAAEYQYIPVSLAVFQKAFSYGKQRLKAAVALKKHN
ncbi:GNAT family N-acetyltransferase/peptidase C39 family protein [Alkalimonas collagenimarina]|uniref:GNAT family N-acetyltransferase/peptidase C39 family protein n=1 Tax=Alkalimonas collagenimarina TaxID=400390 RepID=A0ABT9GWX1_9GAMM|nr:GNAT family N-acetyltransferase/peptidase C39 family protein [Alkalimonas collagenimarina]MDP4535561.1 GNAT family N-acetyltransferase/peptidase C39 family protein [Alkalimonas collagenimarina]